MKTKDTPDTVSCLQRFLPPSQKPERIYTDNAKEINKACQDLPETNGVAERAVRRVKEGIAIALVQRGLPEEWWYCAMECQRYLRKVHDKMADGKTAFKKRFGEKFDGPSMLFGTLVGYIPITAKDKSRVHQFSTKTLSGIFLNNSRF